jgi:hypothetical protein
MRDKYLEKWIKIKSPNIKYLRGKVCNLLKDQIGIVISINRFTETSLLLYEDNFLK